MFEAQVMVVEDQAETLALMEEFLQELGCRVLGFDSGHDASDFLNSHDPPPDCVILDVKLPGISGLEIFERARSRHPDLPIILITAFGNTEEGVEAMKEGAYYYFTKPIDFLLLRRVVGELLEKLSLQYQLSRSDSRSQLGIVGEDPALLDVLHEVELLADLNSTVLITGETGTGKELIARAIHESGKRRNGHFVPVNCAAVPDTLLESELFGYEKGAFTGAATDKPGKLELADEGTLLLDEIGDMPESLQGKLLRVLEDSIVERLGATRGRKMNIRFLASTNTDLSRCIEQGTFRRDLFHRLNVFHLHLPPLRQRKGDLPALVHHFLRQLSSQYGKTRPQIAAAVWDHLLAYDWPGNVRELKHVLERSFVVCQGTLETAHLPPQLRLPPGVSKSHSQLDRLEEEMVRKALALHGGNRSAAARELGLTRHQIRSKIKKYGLD